MPCSYIRPAGRSVRRVCTTTGRPVKGPADRARYPIAAAVRRARDGSLNEPRIDTGAHEVESASVEWGAFDTCFSTSVEYGRCADDNGDGTEPVNFAGHPSFRSVE
ncbi:hypothetical protein MRX96_043198 [Rhipicephalus microplus]